MSLTEPWVDSDGVVNYNGRAIHHDQMHDVSTIEGGLTEFQAIEAAVRSIHWRNQLWWQQLAWRFA